MVIKIDGNWDAGLAYDLHTIDSTYLGVDDHGSKQFDTTYSEMGAYLNRLKYRQDRSVLPDMIKLLDEIKGIEGHDLIIAIPPTNKNRPFQPVEEISKALGLHRNVSVSLDSIENHGDAELKGISDPVERLKLLRNALILRKDAKVEDKKILLVDDLFRSGMTLSVATDLLVAAGAARVNVLTMTKTRVNQ